MIERNIYGESITLEDVFHSLKTRLFRIKYYEDILEHDYELITKSIEDNFLGFKPADCMIYINSNLAEVNDLIDSCSSITSQLSNELNYYKSSLETYKGVVQAGIHEGNKNSLVTVSELPFKKIMLKNGLQINHIPSFYWQLLQEHKLGTSKENLKKMILAVFVDSEGKSLKKATIDTIFKNNKPFARSKDFN